MASSTAVNRDIQTTRCVNPTATHADTHSPIRRPQRRESMEESEGPAPRKLRVGLLNISTSSLIKTPNVTPQLRKVSKKSGLFANVGKVTAKSGSKSPDIPTKHRSSHGSEEQPIPSSKRGKRRKNGKSMPTVIQAKADTDSLADPLKQKLKSKRASVWIVDIDSCCSESNRYPEVICHFDNYQLTVQNIKRNGSKAIDMNQRVFIDENQ